MSFIGRASAWTLAGTAAEDGRRNNGGRTRLTPLDVMTGSRIAASGDGVGLWAHTWDDARWRTPARQASGTGAYEELFDAMSRRGNRMPDARTCPRCGQAAHNDWGYAYERLVCQEITIG